MDLILFIHRGRNVNNGDSSQSMILMPASAALHLWWVELTVFCF